MLRELFFKVSKKVVYLSKSNILEKKDVSKNNVISYFMFRTFSKKIKPSAKFVPQGCQKCILLFLKHIFGKKKRFSAKDIDLFLGHFDVF